MKVLRRHFVFYESDELRTAGFVNISSISLVYVSCCYRWKEGKCDAHIFAVWLLGHNDCF